MQKELRLMLDAFISGDNIQPLLVTEELLIESVNYLNSSEYALIDDLRENVIPNLFLFESDERSFKKDAALEIKEKASIRTSFEFNIIIIREVDKLTIAASNSLLKLLEDVPDRTIFLLTTNAKENLLETIRSRILYFGANEIRFELSYELKDMIDGFLDGDKLPLIGKILNDKIEKPEYIGIIEYFLEKFKKGHKMDKKVVEMMIQGIENVYTTNANPKNILDMIILELD